MCTLKPSTHLAMVPYSKLFCVLHIQYVFIGVYTKIKINREQMPKLRGKRLRFPSEYTGFESGGRKGSAIFNTTRI